MSENNDDFSRKFGMFADKARKTMESAGKSAWNRLDTEKQKAELKSQIISEQKALNCAYEKLGREYYEEKTAGTAMEDEQDLFDLIREKTKTIDLLNEKMKQF